MKLCLAIPAKVVKIRGNVADVDFGSSVLREVNITLVETKVDDFVLVHAGYAIQVIDRKEAEETLKLWREIQEMEASAA